MLNPGGEFVVAAEATGPVPFFDQQVIDSLAVAIYVCNAQGRITMFNKAAERLWGRAPVLGTDLWCGSWRIFRPDGSPMALAECAMARTLKEGRSILGEEILVQRPDGSRHHVLPHPSPLFDRAGNLLGAVNMLIDMTERRRAESQAQARCAADHERIETALQDARSTAESAVRAKDQLLAMFSHELRTPLTPVLVTVAGMEVDPMLPEALRRNLAMVRRNVELEARLIDDLLNLGHLLGGHAPPHPEPVDLNEALRDVCNICRPEALEKELRLEVRLDPQAGRAMVDPGGFQQIAWNVLKNAIKVTPARGTVSVETEPPRSGRVRLQVRDGRGPRALEEADNLATLLDTGSDLLARSMRDERGLSLAIVRTLVQLNGGVISAAHPAQNTGTIFEIELPVAPDDLENHSGSAVSLLSENRKRLLLVEDHEDTARALRKFLEISGFEVRLALGMKDALRQLEQYNCDLVMSDIGLPDATGYELMEQVSRRWHLKGIAISGYGTQDDIRRSRASGFSEHLVKPLKLNQMIATIHEVLGA